MIDVKPTPGNWTDFSLQPYKEIQVNAPVLYDLVPAWKSKVLGPDGNPVMIPVPRNKLGFDLTRKAK